MRRGFEVMRVKKQTVAVFISLYRDLVDEVCAFKDQKLGEAYYKSRVEEDYGSEGKYQKALEYGVNTEHQLHYVELK